MKDSVAFLPPNKRSDLQQIVNLIRKKIPHTEMIILYGSYARNDYVDYDEKEEYGIITTYMSDYDILIVTHGTSDNQVTHELDAIEIRYYQSTRKIIPIQFINESIEVLNKNLSEGRYFYCEVKKDGVFLYNSGRFKLARRKKLHYNEIKLQAEQYYQQKYEYANEFLESVDYFYQKEQFSKAIFMLNQACQNYCYTINLVYTLKNDKQHNLLKLLSNVKKYSKDLTSIFPRNTREEKRLFNLIKVAYIEARYNFDFTVSEKDLNILITKVYLLKNLTKNICEKRIREYDRIHSNQKKHIPSDLVKQ